MENNIILGVDVGIATTGWSIVRKDSTTNFKGDLIDCGAIITKSEDLISLRLKQLYDGLIEVIETHNPTTMAVESIFYFKNQKTIINVSQARGVILLAGESKGLPIFNYTPLQVKTSVTGYGRADKKQIQKMVKLIYGLKAEPKPDDVADAIAVATCHLSTVRF
jgi:crossover junction endodeoxyribonuclease RuvC